MIDRPNFETCRFGVDPVIARLDVYTSFDKWISGQLKVFTRYFGKHENWTIVNTLEDTHIARIVCIEEIKKKECEHHPVMENPFKPNMFNFTSNAAYLAISRNTKFNCAKCGVELIVQWSDKK